MLRGGFGSVMTGLLEDDQLLPVAPSSWTVSSWDWTPDIEHARHREGARTFDVADHEDPTKPSGLRLMLNAEARHIALVGAECPSREALIHPWLTTVCAALAFQRGDDAWHGGSLVVDGRVWAVLGAREAGKSSFLAWAMSAGYGVGSDDLVALRGGIALSGPTCIDLREPTARAFGLGEPVQVMRGRTRWRVTGPPLPAELPFAGFVLPSWGNDTSVASVPPSERMPCLAKNSYVWPLGGDARRLLDLLAFPMLSWSRPRDFRQMDRSGHALLAHLGG